MLTTPSAPIAVLLGTRPEAIKLAPVIRALRGVGRAHLVVTTGQHAALAGDALRIFGIVPDVDLRLMRDEQTLDYLLGAAVRHVGELLEERQPAAVVVQGDTTSMLGSALAAFHHRVPVAHVEAGLRSGDPAHPFPEEMNRRAASVIARWHFAPTERSAANLLSEGIAEGVHVTGNTVVDALRQIVDADGPRLPPDLALFLGTSPYLLATAHRRESWDGGIGRIAVALRDVLTARPDLRLVFVTHPNPVAKAPVEEALGREANALVLDSVDYGAFLALLRGARVAISDSGGVQEEGATLGTPVLVTRTATERPEGVEAGAARLVGTDSDRIRRSVLELLADAAAEERMRAAGRDLYGDGHAADRIVEILTRDLDP